MSPGHDLRVRYGVPASVGTGARQADQCDPMICCMRAPGWSLLPGGHDLPAAVWPRVAAEVRALADRAPVSAGG